MLRCKFSIYPQIVPCNLSIPCVKGGWTSCRTATFESRSQIVRGGKFSFLSNFVILQIAINRNFLRFYVYFFFSTLCISEYKNPRFFKIPINKGQVIWWHFFWYIFYILKISNRFFVLIYFFSFGVNRILMIVRRNIGLLDLLIKGRVYCDKIFKFSRFTKNWIWIWKIHGAYLIYF